jgi:hypothetical protein
MSEHEDELFLMVNLYPARTGLPMTVWAGPRGKARHAARIKVNMAHGNRMDLDNTAVVGMTRRASRVLGAAALRAFLRAYAECGDTELQELLNDLAAPVARGRRGGTERPSMAIINKHMLHAFELRKHRPTRELVTKTAWESLQRDGYYVSQEELRYLYVNDRNYAHLVRHQRHTRKSRNQRVKSRRYTP